MADDASAAARPSLRHANSSGGNNIATSSNMVDSTATSSGVAAPPGHAFRRVRTVAESNPGAAAAAARRQTTTSSPAARRLSSDSSGAFEPTPRRSSNFSDYGVNEARSILNPHGKAAAADGDADQGAQELSSLAGLSLAFALLPAIAGALFKNGGAVTTDIMLLGLAGVFLHWSVTQPWIWYHSAQQVRIQHEASAADIDVFEDDDDELDSDDDKFADGASHLDDVPEDEAARPAKVDDDEMASEKKPTSAAQQSALNELYLHEVMALVSCFSLPLVSAFLLHMIRAQLSRPSEGLVSNYNLTIFVLVSEVRVLSHIIKLVQARTLHLQRIVHNSNPFGGAALPAANSLRINAILERLDALESNAAAVAAVLPEEPDDDDNAASARAAQEAVLTKDVRGAIQPELDALNRAVRRYEKKSTLLQSHVDARLAAIDARVQDSIALAAVAAKNSTQSNSSLLARGFDTVVTIVLFPFHAVLQLFLLPIRWALSLTRGGTTKKTKRNAAAGSGHGSNQPPGKPIRGARGSKTTGQPRYGGDKVPSRLARK